ncbi:SDR family oxidoreductase [Roseateles toxinivorans]|uniref:3-oxoacyl-[acyl-carrier protein] reductase n=1 Tax=Roseateles toxinivorans TaxID=270368 RepID=A0A4R6QLM2_9BURK|nr:SDR family NAD(P)-dependent oxidoreductase [Roseateles toxinivorans]TDP71389.1 3-oxoacyl-[acyl-carrier protein] reductase [Roseateles toxinivorans]
MILHGAQVLLTGGGRGLGRHLLERLLEQGCRVGVLERDESLCAELRDRHGDGVMVEVADLSDAQSADSGVQALIARGLAPELLVNNAGIIHNEPLVNMLARGDRVHGLDSWRRVLSADLDSVFFVTRRVVDDMLRRRCRGVIVSISSIAAHGNAGQSAYAAAKAGVNALTMTWAKELGPLGLRFAAIAPGFIDTPSTRAALSESTLQKLQQMVPLRRLGDPEAVFLAVKHVAENDYVSGTVLEVDGGLSL